MYHFYQPVRPASNLYLQKLIDDHNYNNHLKKLYGIKTGNLYKTKYSETSSEFPHVRNHQRLKIQKKIEIETTEVLKHISDESKKRVDDRNEYEHKSLLYPKRKHDLIKQSTENLSLLNRLVNVKPVVSKTVLGKEWNKQKVYASIVTRYPENWRHFVAEENEFKKKELEKIKTTLKLPKIETSASFQTKNNKIIKEKQEERNLSVI